MSKASHSCFKSRTSKFKRRIDKYFQVGALPLTPLDTPCPRQYLSTRHAVGARRECNLMLKPLPKSLPQIPTVKVEPFPSSLWTVISPLCAFTSSLTKCRPKPVPPCRRVVLMSTWSKQGHAASYAREDEEGKEIEHSWKHRCLKSDTFWGSHNHSCDPSYLA